MTHGMVPYRAIQWRNLILGCLGIAFPIVLYMYPGLGLFALPLYGIYQNIYPWIGESTLAFLVFGSPVFSLIGGVLVILNKIRWGGILLIFSGIGTLVGWFGPVGWIAGPVLIISGILAYKPKKKWYLAAAEQGDAKAQSYLASKYISGKGMPQDYTEALKWYQKAAEQGDVNAQLNLGVMYANGQGTQVDLLQAYMCFSLASMAGDEVAEESKARLEKKMSSDQVGAAQALLREWLDAHKK